MRRPYLAAILLLFSLTVIAQEKSPVKFGKISPDDFKKTTYEIDQYASAVVIADIGSSEISGNNKGWFSIQFKHFKRIHILNKNGYDLANVEIPLYTDGRNEEELAGLKAITYNLDNGKVVESKLDAKSSVFKDKYSKNMIVKKFTFPAVKEGSIIEFEYTVNSDFIFNLQPWEFQGSYPRLWSEYEVTIPEFLYYVFLTQGMQYDYSKTQNSRQGNFRISDSRGTGPTEVTPFTATVTDHRMIMKNVPALKEESFTTTLNNHIAKVEFQLAEFRYPLNPRNIMGNWVTVCDELLKSEDFGQQLSRDNGWMNDDIKLAVSGAIDEEAVSKNIYRYVQRNFTCTNYSRLYTDQPLKNILKDKKGSEAEINLLLVAMLRKAGLSADPVMLSTRSHGYTYPIYPIMDRFNYVVCMAMINGKELFLDASRPTLGYGHLHWECYNGHARVINKDATPLSFTADSLSEKKLTSLILFNSESGIVGMMQQTPGYYESYSLRNKLKESGKQALLSDIKKAYGTDVEISNDKFDSVDQYDMPLYISYGVKLNLEKNDIIYLNPVFGEAYKENPFKSAERSYPVEMPYAMDETFVLRMDVPEGYAVDEVPKSIRVNFDETGTSFFEYLVNASGGVISLRTRIKMIRTYYLPEEYEILRDFFNMIVSKQAEQIVFKKK